MCVHYSLTRLLRAARTTTAPATSRIITGIATFAVSPVLPAFAEPDVVEPDAVEPPVVLPLVPETVFVAP